jgi:phosphotransferase system enzyme I (PtsP)
MERAGGLTASRLLLRRLRDVMAGGATAQQRLDKIVALIAGAMVAEVCSAYVRRAGDMLELFATQGLKPEAVHKTRLRVGEGLVGDIAAHARALALADAQSHPNFAYRPETGEEIYHSLMGVPILRGGRVLGVLVVQNRALRNYTDEEVEALETIAMVVAELVASGELIGPEEIHRETHAAMPMRLEGLGLSEGIAMGAAVLHEPQVVLRQLVAEDPERELERLRTAVAGMKDALDTMLAAADIAAGGEHRDILETYRMFAEDRGWIGRIAEAIRSGLTAEAAVQKVKNDTRARMAQVTDPYLHERLLDLDDLANRLLQHLSGGAVTGAVANGGISEDAILVARNMGPAELLDYDRRHLRGLVLEEGSATAHVAIVARALDIPVVGRVANALIRIAPGDHVVVDGINGLVLVRPSEDALQAYARAVRERRERQAVFVATRDLPAVTRDGQHISLNINAGLLLDMPHLNDSGADGVGLYRTEIPFMVRSAFPDVASQTEFYRKVLEQAGSKPVIFRTLDVGGDKVLPYWAETEEENPAMGWRAIRIALDRPSVLRQQLRALLAAASGRPLWLMFPMIADVAEFDAACSILEMERARARRFDAAAPSEVRVGAMFEVPSLAWQLPALLERVDFLSVGSNDLRQFLFASDRGNPRLAERYDVLSAPMLNLLAHVVREATARGVPVGLCGEMAGDPLEAMALIGLGFRSLSMPPSAIGPVKIMARSLEAGPLRHYLEALLAQPHRSIRPHLRAYARDHDIAI